MHGSKKEKFQRESCLKRGMVIGKGLIHMEVQRKGFRVSGLKRDILGKVVLKEGLVLLRD